MKYKLLENILPLELVIYISEFDNTSKENMNKVIQELNDYNDRVDEYEMVQHYEWVWGDRLELNTNKRKSWQMKCPYLLTNDWRFH